MNHDDLKNQIILLKSNLQKAEKMKSSMKDVIQVNIHIKRKNNSNEYYLYKDKQITYIKKRN